MSTPISPLAPDTFPDVPNVKGVRISTAAAGVKYKNRTDVMLAVLDPGTTIAGVFTRSATRSAPVLDCQEKIGGASDQPAAFLVNSGNANAFTGRAGEDSVAKLCAAVGAAADVPESRAFTSSTGVIGERLPHDRIIATISEMAAKAGDTNMEDAAKAIMTTDTFAKGASATVQVDGQAVQISGIAKGSGMIAPDMATMLVYVFTDAKISPGSLQRYTSDLCASTFNKITVDSDTSTSDTLLVAATGASGIDVDAVSTDGKAEFVRALYKVMLDLAHQVVRDGEGASKFVEINISGAATVEDGQRAAMAIANSPLVKTAIAGEDPNWGRIVMAVGKSGAAADRDKLSIWFGDILVAEHGWVADSYREEDGAQYMKNQNITISVDLGVGQMHGQVWTCDLTHQYITINADYRS